MIQDHVVSLDLAKQLYEAGIVVETLFDWCIFPVEPVITYCDPMKDDHPTWFIPAPLSSELAEMMAGKGMGVMAKSTLGTPEWWCTCGTWDAGTQKYEGIERDKTMPDMLARVALYLKKEGKI